VALALAGKPTHILIPPKHTALQGWQIVAFLQGVIILS
jgi:hypothetical protein